MHSWEVREGKGDTESWPAIKHFTHGGAGPATMNLLCGILADKISLRTAYYKGKPSAAVLYEMIADHAYVAWLFRQGAYPWLLGAKSPDEGLPFLRLWLRPSIFKAPPWVIRQLMRQPFLLSQCPTLLLAEPTTKGAARLARRLQFDLGIRPELPYLFELAVDDEQDLAPYWQSGHWRYKDR